MFDAFWTWKRNKAVTKSGTGTGGRVFQGGRGTHEDVKQGMCKDAISGKGGREFGDAGMWDGEREDVKTGTRGREIGNVVAFSTC